MAHVDPTDAEKAAKKRLLNPRVLLPPERLRSLREALGLSQEAASDQMGVSGPAVHSWETGGTPTRVSPYLIEAWSKWASDALGLGSSAVIVADEWLTEEQRAVIRSIPLAASSPVPGAR